MATSVTPHVVRFTQEIGREAGCSADSLSTSQFSWSWSDTKTGVANPLRKRQIARGQNASTDYTWSGRTFEMPGVRVDGYSWDTACSPKKRRHDWRIVNGANLGLVATASDLSSASADNLARTKAYQSILRQQQAFQSLVCVGELGETLRMLTSAGRRLRRTLVEHVTRSSKAVGSIKKRRRGETLESLFLRRTRTAADLHLQFVFGARPFFSDIGSANAWLERRLELVDPSLPFKGKGEDRTNVNAVVTGGSGFTAYRGLTHTNTSVEVRYYGKVSGRTLGNKALVESRLLGVNLGEWLPSVYELIPWSFFIDYFSNLGNVVESWSAWDSGVLWTSKTTWKQRSVSADSWAWTPAGTGSPTFATGSASGQGRHLSTNTSIVRSKDATLTPPSLAFRVPGTGLKWLNIAALAVALSGGSRSLSQSLGRPVPRWMNVPGAANW